MNLLRALALLVIFSAVAATTHASPAQPICVVACEKWNDTGVMVQAGQMYRVEVVSLDAKDWGIDVSGLEGARPDFRHRVFDFVAPWIKRRPREPYMALIATVDRRHPVRVRETFTAPASGQLSLFFNDASFAYWNNTGCACLRITKL